MSFANREPEKEVEFKPVNAAKDELKALNDSRMLGERYMNTTREPFCGACLNDEYKLRIAAYEAKRKSGIKNPPAVTVPAWQEYAGKDKFNLLGMNEYKHAKDATFTTEMNYECKKNSKHHVSVHDSKPWHPAVQMATA